MNTKKLHREEEMALVAGVLSGLAKYFKQDPVLFRLVAIVLLVVTGIFPGLIIYIIGWIMIPKKTKPEADYTIVD